MLDTKITNLKNHFGIFQDADWQEVEPAWILGIDGIGPVTLDYIRLLLANRGLTLKNDRTPEYWQANLSRARIMHTLGDDEEGEDRADICPFTILVDSQEQHPFTFQGIMQDATRKNRPLIVPTEWKALGHGWGDYSIVGYEGRAHIERKSVADAASTFLGWGDHRDRFEAELNNLAAIECAAVIVEATLGDLVAYVRGAPPRGRKTPLENAKILFRQVLAWQQDYRIPWIFCNDRRGAEVACFRVLERFHRKNSVKSQSRLAKERIENGNRIQKTELEPVS